MKWSVLNCTLPPYPIHSVVDSVGVRISCFLKAAWTRGVATRERVTTCSELRSQWWTTRRTASFCKPLPGPSGSSGEPGTDPFWCWRRSTATLDVNNWNRAEEVRPLSVKRTSRVIIDLLPLTTSGKIPGYSLIYCKDPNVAVRGFPATCLLPIQNWDLIAVRLSNYVCRRVWCPNRLRMLVHYLDFDFSSCLVDTVLTPAPSTYGTLDSHGAELLWSRPNMAAAHTLNCPILLSTQWPWLIPAFVRCWSTSADIMEEDLMFSMEEEEGSAKRPSVHRRGASQRTCSFTKSSTSDDDDEDHVIRPILEDSAKEICHYLKDLANTRQLSNSLPKGSFTYRVSFRRARSGRTDGPGLQTACVPPQCAEAP